MFSIESRNKSQNVNKCYITHNLPFYCFMLLHHSQNSIWCCISKIMLPVTRCHRSMFCLGKRCQQQVCLGKHFRTQFRYQLVFFVHIYGYIWLAEGCLWHLLPRQNLRWHLLPRQNLPLASFDWRHQERFTE